MLVFDPRMLAGSQSFVVCLFRREQQLRLVAVSLECESDLSGGRFEPPFLFLSFYQLFTLYLLCQIQSYADFLNQPSHTQPTDLQKVDQISQLLPNFTVISNFTM